MPATVAPTDLLADLARRGFTVRVVVGSLSVTPGSLLTPSDRQAIQARRVELLRILSRCEPWNTATALRLIEFADARVERLALDGSDPEIAHATAVVASAHATRDMETLRFALAEFAAVVRGLAAHRATAEHAD